MSFGEGAGGQGGAKLGIYGGPDGENESLFVADWISRNNVAAAVAQLTTKIDRLERDLVHGTLREGRRRLERGVDVLGEAEGDLLRRHGDITISP